MVQRRRRKIGWTVNALLTKKNIFYYWNNRNKSTVYSQKLNQLFTATLHITENSPESSIATKKENIRAILVRDYYLIFEITELTIKVLDIWDTRQNPQNYPIK
ncbi:type II toxin-antitoxin system RelE/ParE family toxin [Flavobacterium sp.]|uniref:type II toxin-antitoxin system RelE/ParE family toxin n=1 Tax=Flavobacterium sp. TaxID=239 RepID=UPI00379934DB